MSDTFSFTVGKCPTLFLIGLEDVEKNLTNPFHLALC